MPRPGADNASVQGRAIAVDELAPGTYKPRRQDIVVVHPTAEYTPLQPGELMIRRVIAVPGDTVSCAGIGSPLILNYSTGGDRGSDAGPQPLGDVYQGS
jgi:Signal peptidase, peptidase S26